MQKLAIDYGSLETAATSGKSIGDLISKILEIFIPIAGFILLFYLIWASYQYMTSGGDPKGMQTARNNITYALIGFILIISAYYVAQLFGVVLNLKGIMDLFS